MTEVTKETALTIEEEDGFTCDVYVDGEHEWDMAAADGTLRIEIDTTEVEHV